MIFDLVRDFTDVLDAMPAEHPRQRILKLINEAIRRDVNFINRHPTELFQCLWNTGWWYDNPGSEEHYVPPKGGWPPGVVPWQGPGPKLYDLLEYWRSQRETASVDGGSVCWLRSSRPPMFPLGSAQLLQLTGHAEDVGSIAYSPDGHRIVSGSGGVLRGVSGPPILGDISSVRLWDAESGSQIAQLTGYAGVVQCVAFSPDGHRIATASYDDVRIWDADTGEQTLQLEGFSTVAFSPDSQRIASKSGGVRIWNTDTGELVAETPKIREAVGNLAFSPDGHRIATGSLAYHGGDVELWDACSGERIARFTGHTGAVHSVAFSPDGRRIASASSDKTIRIWDASGDQQIAYFTRLWRALRFRLARHTGSHELTAVLTGHEWEVRCVTFSPDGRRIASGSGGHEHFTDNSIRIWDAEICQQVKRLIGHTGSVNSVAFSPDGRRIASASSDKTIRIWDAQGSKSIGRLNQLWQVVRDGRLTGDAKCGDPDVQLVVHSSRINNVALSPNGRRIVSTSTPDTLFAGYDSVKVWSAVNGNPVAEFNGALINALSTNGDDIVSGSLRGKMWLRDQKSGELIGISSDGCRIVSGSHGRRMWLRDIESGERIAQFTGHTGTIRTVAFSPDGRRIAGDSDDGSVCLWDASGGEPIARFTDYLLEFSPDSRYVTTGSGSTGGVRVWDADNGEPIDEFSGEFWAFSPDGRRIASTSSRDNTVQVWDADSGQLSSRATEHPSAIKVAAFSPDSCRIAFGFSTGAWLWDTSTNESMELRIEENWENNRIAFSPDGRRLAIGDDGKHIDIWRLHSDSRVGVWDTESGECVEIIEGIGDVEAIAAGPAAYPWRLIGRDSVTVIESAMTGETVSWFPIALCHVSTYPSGDKWVGANANNIYIVNLEGDAATPEDQPV